MSEKDPGNSEPDEWTEDLPEDEQAEIRRLLLDDEEVDDGDRSTGH